MKQEDAEKAIQLATDHAGTDRSALLCLEDATNFLNRKYYHIAVERALRSLEYSVGTYHDDYKLIRAMCNAAELFDEVRKWIRNGGFLN